MNVVILNGSPHPNGHTANLVNSFKIGAINAGHNVEVLQVGTMKICGCVGCEFCHTQGNGTCAIKDDMQKVYTALNTADVIVFASAVYYWGLTGQLQSTLSRFYSIGTPKAKTFALLLTSHSPNVYDAIISQYNDVVSYFGAKSVGIVTAFGEQRQDAKKHTEALNLGKSL